MAAYAARYEDADVLLLEPERTDYLMAFTNIFGFSERRAVCEHAYQSTRRWLLANYDQLSPVLARHGVTLLRDALEEERDLWQQVGLPRAEHKRAAPPAPSPPAPSRVAPSPPAVVHRLDDALTRLERLVAQQEGHDGREGAPAR